MANRQDFKRLEDGGKAGVFVGVLGPMSRFSTS